MLVATHDGSFHADEAFAVAALSLLPEPIEVIRTRDADRLAAADLRVDVGFRYDPAAGDFDHHQRDFELVRSNGVGYASFGIVWREFGARICGGDEDVAAAVEESLVQAVDANDTGQQITTSLIEGVRPLTVNAVIGGFNARWDEELSADEERARFDAAVDLAAGILEREIGSAAAGTRAAQIVRDAIAAAEDPRIVQLPGQRPLEAGRDDRGSQRPSRHLPEAPGVRGRDRSGAAGDLREPAGPPGRVGGPGEGRARRGDRSRRRALLPREALPRRGPLARGRGAARGSGPRTTERSLGRRHGASRGGRPGGPGDTLAGGGPQRPKEIPMGFMDRFKGGMDQAQQMAKQAGDAMSAGTDPATMAYAQLANKLAASGVPCTAVIQAVGMSGATDGFNKEYTFEVVVEGNGEPYNAIIVQYLADGAEKDYAEGAAFQAKADPDDKTSLLLYGKLS